MGLFLKRLKPYSAFAYKLMTNLYEASLPTTQILCTPRPNLTFTAKRNLHWSSPHRTKLFLDTENTYAYNVLPEIPIIKPLCKSDANITSINEFDRFLNQNWRASDIGEIVSAFEKVKDISIKNSIDLSDKRFDKLVDGLMDHCEKLTDEDLLKLLSTLPEYPECESSDSHNYVDVWNCLDDICCWKMDRWNTMKMFSFLDCWYKLQLGRRSDFVFQVLDKVTQKPHRLSKNMLVHACFYLNVHRRVDICFDFESALAQRINEFGIDELAIIAMGFFKSKKKVKLTVILERMVEVIVENCDTINEISLTAMLKVIRLSQKLDVGGLIPPMLDKLVEQIPRLSPMAIVHVAIVGTTLGIKHETSILKCAEKILQDIENVRIKDIERILLACSMFNIDTKPSIFQKARTEISKESRKKEIIQYNRALLSILNYLSIQATYHYSFMNQVLDPEYIDETFGASSRSLPRDLLSLDCCIDIECPDYQGKRMLPYNKYRSIKWYLEYTPSREQRHRLSVSDRSYLDVSERVKEVVGAGRFLRSDHVLPHFCKPDIILCRRRESGEFVEPFGFENYVLGDVKRPFDVVGFEWIAVVIVTQNLAVRGSGLALGSVLMKERQLRKIGYKPILVHTNQFFEMEPAEKLAFLKSRLS